MQIPSQISFKHVTPNGSKLTATIEGDDLPNIIQVKGTNDIAKVNRKRDRPRPADWGPITENDEREDDDEYDRDERGCHRFTMGRWESKARYKSLKQTLIFIKKRRCTRVIQEASYDEQGKLVNVTPIATITSNSSIALNGNTVDLVWTSAQENLIREYACETKLSTESQWRRFDSEMPMGAGTTYRASDVPAVSGRHEYRVVAEFSDNSAPKVLLTQALDVTVNTGGQAEIQNFSAQYSTNFFGIEVLWTSTAELSIKEYQVELKPADAGDEAYQLAERSDAFGAGFQYSLAIFPVEGTAFPGPGNYTLRLKAVFLDSSEKIIPGTITNIVVPVEAGLAA
jgi:hypothetical protein